MIFARASEEHAFRKQTERQADMPGATVPSFICLGCNRSRLVVGRKKTALGYRCAACMQRRAERQAAKRAA